MLPCAKPTIETAEYAYFRLEQEQMSNRRRIFQAHGYQPFRFRQSKKERLNQIFFNAKFVLNWPVPIHTQSFRIPISLT